MSRLTVAEMASFIEASYERQLDDWKMYSKVGYVAGLVGSMGLQKKRPGYDEFFVFPKKKDVEAEKEKAAKRNEAEMIVWATKLNKQYREAQRKKEGDNV